MRHGSHNFVLLPFLTLSFLFLFQVTVIVDQKSSVQKMDFISLRFKLYLLKLPPEVWGGLSNKMVA
jgi:hypothetical protein